MPTAPRSICRAAIRGDLWVLAWGRSRRPCAFAAACMRDRLRVSFDASTRTAGVGISVMRKSPCHLAFGVLGIPVPRLLLDDQLDGVALVLIEKIVDRPGGAWTRPRRAAAAPLLPSGHDQGDHKDEKHDAPDDPGCVVRIQSPDYAPMPTPGSGDKPEPLRVGESGEDRAGIGDRQMAAHNFGEYAAEVGRDGEVAPVVALFAREPGPAPVDLPAADVLSTDDHHGVAVAMVGAAVAVLGDGPAKLAHRQDDDVGHAIAEVPRQGGKAAREIVEAARQLSGGGSDRKSV